MKKIIILLLLTSSLSLFGHEIVTVNLYASTHDYLNRNYSHINAKAELLKINNRYIRLRKFIDAETGKKIKRPNKYSWMVEYEGENYFNMGYSPDLPRWNLFVKLDIEGKRLGAFFLDRTMQEEISGTNYGSYGGGLSGILTKESEKWGANWINSDGEKLRILIIDFNIIQPKYANRNESSWGVFLTKRHLIELLGMDKKVKELKEMKFEEAAQLLRELNNAN